MYGNQLAGNAAGSLLGGMLVQPTGVVCGNKVQNDEDYEGNPLTMECPDYVRISVNALHATCIIFLCVSRFFFVWHASRGITLERLWLHSFCVLFLTPWLFFFRADQRRKEGLINKGGSCLHETLRKPQ